MLTAIKYSPILSRAWVDKSGVVLIIDIKPQRLESLTLIEI